MQATADLPRIHCWRDKSGREIDFVIPRGERVDSIEVKWSAEAFEAKHLAHFRKLYPEGDHFLVTGATTRRETRTFGEHRVHVVPIRELRPTLSSMP